MHKHCNKSLVSLFAFCLVGSLQGQTEAAAEEEPVQLEDFVVKGVNLVKSADLLGTPVDLLSGDQLKRQTGASLGETLAWEPGVSSSFYGPVASRPIIRGQGGYRVGIFNGGTQTGDLSGASPDHAIAQEPLFIEEIEIIRGPAALLYGSSAIGGAVNMKTKTLPRYAPNQPLEAEAEVRYDSVKEGRTAGVASKVGSEAFAVQVNGLVRETDSYQIPGFARTSDYDITNRSRLPPGVPQPAPNSRGTVPNTQSSLNTGSVGASRFWDQGWAGAAFVFYNTDYGVPSDGHAHGNPAGQTFGPGPNDQVTVEMRQNRGEVETELWPNSTWIDNLSFKAQYSDLMQQEFEGSYLANQFDAQTFDTRLEVESTGTDTWQFAGGASFSGFELDNTNVSYVAGRADEDQLSTRSLTGAIFGFTQYTADKWDARVGARVEYQHAERRDLSNFDRQDSALSLSLGGGYRLSEDYKISLTLAQLQRLPTADEFYVEAPHGATGIFQISNPGLENEESLGMDLALMKDQGRWTFTILGFLRKFDNYIFLENQGFEVDGLPAYSYVQREAVFYGGEIESAWKLIERNNEQLTFTLIWDVVYGTDTTEDDHLPRLPPMRLGARFDYERDRWSLGLGLRHAFAQNRVPQAVFGRLDYQSPTPSYTFLDANFAYTISRGNWESRLFLNATNLTDAEGRSATSFLKDVAPLPGRNFTLGLEIHY